MSASDAGARGKRRRPRAILGGNAPLAAKRLVGAKKLVHPRQIGVPLQRVVGFLQSTASPADHQRARLLDIARLLRRGNRLRFATGIHQRAAKLRFLQMIESRALGRRLFVSRRHLGKRFLGRATRLRKFRRSQISASKFERRHKALRRLGQMRSDGLVENSPSDGQLPLVDLLDGLREGFVPLVGHLVGLRIPNRRTNRAHTEHKQRNLPGIAQQLQHRRTRRISGARGTRWSGGSLRHRGSQNPSERAFAHPAPFLGAGDTGGRREQNPERS